jgi:hypothetical protein
MLDKSVTGIFSSSFSSQILLHWDFLAGVTTVSISAIHRYFTQAETLLDVIFA